MTVENIVEELKSKLSYCVSKNTVKDTYYYSKNLVKDLGVNTPDTLKNLSYAISWPAMAVETVAERIAFDGFWNPDPEDEDTTWLNDIFHKNSFASKQKESLKNSLINGIGFISVGVGDTDKGEPEVLWMTEDASKITVEYDHRTQKVVYALRNVSEDKVVLYTENATYTLIYVSEKDNSKWRIIETDEHNLGMVPIIPLINNADSKHPLGQSEISKSIISNTDSALRVLLGTDIAREYYSYPQRYLIGAKLQDILGLKKSGGAVNLHTKAGDVAVVPQTEDDNGTSSSPTLQEFTGSDPSVILNMLGVYGRLIAREIGVTPSYVGFDTVNPSSADAINAAEDKLLRRVDARIPFLRTAYHKLAEYSLKLSGREIDDNFYKTQVSFARTDTITRQAAADRVSKLSAMGIFERELPDFIYNELGFSYLEKKQLKAWLSSQNAVNVIDILSAGIEEGE